MSLIKDWGHLPRVGSGCGGQENVFASSKLLRLYYICLCVTVCKTTPLSSSNFKTPVLPLPFGGGAAPVKDQADFAVDMLGLCEREVGVSGPATHTSKGPFRTQDGI